MRYPRPRSAVAALVAGGLVAGLVTNPVAPTVASAASSGATATYAEGPGATPNYILPLLTGAYYSVANIEQFQRLSYRSLYWIGEQGKPVVNPTLSLANLPTYSDNNSVVNITLRKYNWSDGTPVTSRDITFWINLLEANKKDIAFYIPGEFPDNLKSYKVTGPESIQLTLTGPVNPHWFTYDQLSQITPIPQQTWDRTSASGAIGNYDESKAGAVQVFNFLTAQSKTIATYGTNPLWQTVDGPWKLNQYQSDGYVQFKANPAYSGPDTHAIQYFVEEPFTTDTAELDVLRSGNTIDYGYLPPQDAAQSGALKSEGYSQSVWWDWGITFFVFNFHNPTVGPIFAQAYFRQAMQSLIDEQAFIKGPLNGFGHTDYGPVPSQPATFATPYEIKGPWPYDPAKAVSMLKAHGWDVRPNGVSTCAKPTECGAGVKAGAKLDFNLAYGSGNLPVSEEMQGLKSDFAAAGIDINLSSAPFDTIISESAPCTSCSWEMSNWGGGWLFGVDPYPTGDQIFATGSGSNFANYSSATADKLIDETVHGTASLAAYQNYLADEIPVLWLPQAPFQISEISTKLHGALPQSPILSLTPEDWSLSG
ncbi:MAG TPA: ABC transporter substrate-binding protein [Acidimicrobiales bacterium]|nr:ABC transporter substrate-binding protein [Acidimicrobiales bacterium]